MSILYSDGFDHYAPKSVTGANLTAYLQRAGYVLNNTASAISVVDGVALGSFGIRINTTANAATPPNISRTFESNADIVRFGFNFNGSGTRTRIVRVPGVFELNWSNVNGKVSIGEVESVNVIIMNNWWGLDIEIDRIAEEIRVYINNTLQITAPLEVTLTNSHTVTWGMNSAYVGPASTMLIDDFVINDSNGTYNTTRIGPTNIVTRDPTADVNAEWTVVGTSNTNHYVTAAQNEPGKEAAPYLQANVDGKEDMFTSNIVLPNANTVYAVSLVAYARKGDLDDRSLGMVVGTSSGEIETEMPLTENPQFLTTVYNRAPGDVEWNQERVESSEFGIRAR